MRILGLSAAVLLAVCTLASARTRVSTARYFSPAEPGDIYTVIDFAQAGGTAQGIFVNEVMGRRHRDFSAVPRYHCAQTTPVGIVVRFRHFTSDSVQLTLTTTGTIIRGPYQGEAPPETLHHCYQLMS